MSNGSLVPGIRGDVNDKCNTIAKLLFEILLKYEYYDYRSGTALQIPWQHLKYPSWCFSWLSRLQSLLFRHVIIIIIIIIIKQDIFIYTL